MRAFLLAAGLSLGALAAGSLQPALAHVGHGDEFQQQGDVRQVPVNGEIDALLGITTAPATTAGGVVSIPVAAVVKADGKSLVFVKYGTTYDPVFIKTGSSSGDQIEVSEGVTAGEEVVIQGGLSLYAESKKSEGAAADEPPATASSAPPAPASTPAAGSPSPLVIGAATLAVAVVLGGVVATRRGHKH
ncbi:hypothetical protein KBY97_03115 [Synechococcus sp. ATX 2A4]|uniref:hypothetical protein n=1 Tax=Synechococcus sp. ATX 2A4 TaxID=2823727 RepID=UPI0020CF829C|nr:hypothetical protein [Synechococcus sp. ATX 2A4]MCP9884120.1 hypothetical protein [Synechococcus sp. ATX 2A4]